MDRDWSWFYRRRFHLKSSEEHLNHGLTASVGIWTTAAVGIAIGPGQVGIALITVVLIILIFVVIATLETPDRKASAAIVNGC